MLRKWFGPVIETNKKLQVEFVLIVKKAIEVAMLKFSNDPKCVTKNSKRVATCIKKTTEHFSLAGGNTLFRVTAITQLNCFLETSRERTFSPIPFSVCPIVLNSMTLSLHGYTRDNQLHNLPFYQNLKNPIITQVKNKK